MGIRRQGDPICVVKRNLATFSKMAESIQDIRSPCAYPLDMDTPLREVAQLSEILSPQTKQSPRLFTPSWGVRV